MINEKLIVENFAGLKKIKIEVKKINVLIGPQASGKSVIAKILFYCKGFFDEIFSQGMRNKYKRDLDSELITKFEEYFPADSWGGKDFYIRYSIGEEYIEIKKSGTRRKNPSVAINYSDFYRKSFDKIRRISKRIQKDVSEKDNPNIMFSRLDMIIESQIQFLEEVSSQLGQESSFSQLFVPAGRSFFANLKNTIFSLLSENEKIDPFLIEFGDYYETVKNSERIKRIRSNQKLKKPFNDIEKIKEEILCGQYVKVEGKDYLKMNDGRQVRLSNCSSGQQEALPLTLILESLPFFGRGLTGHSTYIEEPEAHLFPKAQKDIVDLIATVYNFRKKQLQFFITTHSPYILTSFNNLLQAGILSKNLPEDKVKEIEKIIPSSRFLAPDELAVYSLSDGSCMSIICSETNLINAEIIDAISQDLAIQFDKLLDIE